MVAEFKDKQSICNDVLEKQIINYEAAITVDENECLNKNDWTEIKFELNGFPNDKLLVQVKCEECVCKEDLVENATQCSGQGDLICGGCQCHKGVCSKQFNKWIQQINNSMLSLFAFVNKNESHRVDLMNL